MTTNEPANDASRQVTIQSQDRESVSDADLPRLSLLQEFREFLRHNRKWWLFPILFGLIALAIIAVLLGSTAVPFIYQR